MGSSWRPDGTLSDGSMDVQLLGRNAVDAQTLWTPGMLYNGATSDMPRGNAQGTLLASAARTATISSPTQTNYNAKGVMVFLNVTASSGTGGLTTRIFSVDPVSGSAGAINIVSPAVIANSLNIYTLYPSVSGASYSNSPLPRIWYVQVSHGDATSYTYSLGYSLIL